MWPFGKKKRSSKVLITIGSTAVSGTYVEFVPEQLPIVHYSVRHLIEERKNEKLEVAMLRTLEHVGTDLIESGAPALRRATGDGFIDSVQVSIAGPWQKMNVRSIPVSPGGEFTFTRKMLSEIVASSSEIPDTRIQLSESVIATILNGYPIKDPIGKTAKRAEVVILSSTLERAVTEQIRDRIRRLYHTHAIEFSAFAPVSYSVLRDVYPHEKNFLALDVAALDTDLIFIKNGLLIDVGTLPIGLRDLSIATTSAERLSVAEESRMVRETSDVPGYIQPDRNARRMMQSEEAKEKWLRALTAQLQTFSEQHALPRTLFVMTNPDVREYIKKALNDKMMHELWLSDESLCVIALTSEQFASSITQKAESDISIFMSIFILFVKKTKS